MRPFFSALALLVLGSALVVMMLPSVGLAATDIGKVIAFVPGANVLRGGKTEPLALHAGIRVSDTIQTDAAGRVKVLFNDDSSLSLGPDTSMDMKDYVDTGAKPAFAVHVLQGMARAITGKIVDQNPEGFKMSSPVATVGIRGTIVTMHVERGQSDRTTVYVENTLRKVYVNNENVISGNKWIHEKGGSRQERITPEDRRSIGKEMAFRGGNGVAAAAPEAGQSGKKREGTEQRVAAKTGPLLPLDTPLKDIPLNIQKLGDSLLAVASTPMGHVSGSLSSTMPGYSGGGTFNFDVNLSSGAISNGNLNTLTNTGSYNIVANFSGGTGNATSAWWMMNNFATGSVIENGLPASNISAVVSGTDNLLTSPAGSLPGGASYTISGGPSIPTTIDAGTGTATLSK